MSSWGAGLLAPACWGVHGGLTHTPWTTHACTHPPPPRLPRARSERPAVAASLSARVGSIGDNRLGGWYSYRASKAALNQLVRTASVEVARTHPQAVVVALHPGTVATGLSARHLGGHPAVPPAEAAANLLRVIGGLTPADTGGFFDWAGKPVPW